MSSNVTNIGLKFQGPTISLSRIIFAKTSKKRRFLDVFFDRCPVFGQQRPVGQLVSFKTQINVQVLHFAIICKKPHVRISFRRKVIKKERKRGGNITRISTNKNYKNWRVRARVRGPEGPRVRGSEGPQRVEGPGSYLTNLPIKRHIENFPLHVRNGDTMHLYILP